MVHNFYRFLPPSAGSRLGFASLDARQAVCRLGKNIKRYINEKKSKKKKILEIYFYLDKLLKLIKFY